MNDKALHFICGAIIAETTTFMAPIPPSQSRPLSQPGSAKSFGTQITRSLRIMDALDIIATLAGGVIVAAAWDVRARMRALNGGYRY